MGGLKSSHPLYKMNYLSNKILIASLFLVPLASIIPIPGTIVWYPQFIALMLLGFLLLAVGLWQMNKFLSIFMAYCTFSYIFVANQHPRALLCLIIGYLGCYISLWISNSVKTESMYRAILAFCVVNFGMVLLQAFGHDPIFHTLSSDSSKREIIGFLGSYNQLGAYSAIVTPLLFAITPVLSLISIIPAILSKTSTGVIAIIISILTYLYLTKRYVLMGLLALGLIIGAIIYFRFDNNYSNSFSERFKLWEFSIDQLNNGQVKLDNAVIRTNPILGFGIGSFMVISPSSQKNYITEQYHRYEHAHNDLIECLFEYGYLGLILLLLVVSSIMYNFYLVVNKSKRLIMIFCCLIATAICSMGVYVTHAPVSFFMMMVMLGLFYAEVKNASKSV